MKKNNFISQISQRELKELFGTLENYIDLLIIVYGDGSPDAERLRRAKKTLIDLRRLSVRANAIWMAELGTMIGMIIYNLIAHEGHTRAGLAIYPAMLVAGIYGCILMDKMEKKAQLFAHQMKDKEFSTQK